MQIQQLSSSFSWTFFFFWESSQKAHSTNKWCQPSPFSPTHIFGLDLGDTGALFIAWITALTFSFHCIRHVIRKHNNPFKHIDKNIQVVQCYLSLCSDLQMSFYSGALHILSRDKKMHFIVAKPRAFLHWLILIFELSMGIQLYLFIQYHLKLILEMQRFAEHQ